mgnify:CR=1 FL=1
MNFIFGNILALFWLLFTGEMKNLNDPTIIKLIQECSDIPGVCKEKSECLYRSLDIYSDYKDKIRLCLGKYREDSTSLHAWVQYKTNGREYILDPTIISGSKRHPLIWTVKSWKAQGYYKEYEYSDNETIEWIKINA